MSFQVTVSCSDSVYEAYCIPHVRIAFYIRLRGFTVMEVVQFSVEFSACRTFPFEPIHLSLDVFLSYYANDVVPLLVCGLIKECGIVLA